MCRQRVLQEGRQIPLVLFWEGRKGWGLRTIFKIPKNVFVGEYVGESFDGNHKARQQIPGDRRHKPRK
ncbi:unnamed protein product, partial [Mesorhabditis belari]|uniref:Uncharacterized protein n=1 Tax=Mesorhabditis belari TaxID=2138241 RepID=A0AAF3F9A9_9BILA